jgi:hypothetical protein
MNIDIKQTLIQKNEKIITKIELLKEEIYNLKQQSHYLWKHLLKKSS